MHELSVCQALLRQVAEIAKGRGASAVERITIEVGPLCGIEPELLASAFAVLRAGGCAAQAALLIESTTVTVSCLELRGAIADRRRIGWCVWYAAGSAHASSPEMSCACAVVELRMPQSPIGAGRLIHEGSEYHVSNLRLRPHPGEQANPAW